MLKEQLFLPFSSRQVGQTPHMEDKRPQSWGEIYFKSLRWSKNGLR